MWTGKGSAYAEGTEDGGEDAEEWGYGTHDCVPGRCGRRVGVESLGMVRVGFGRVDVHLRLRWRSRCRDRCWPH